MKKDEVGILNKVSYYFSPFFDTKESLEIKKFAREIRKTKEFSDMKINIVQFSNNPLFKKKMKLTNSFFSNSRHLITAVSRPNVGGCYDTENDKIFLYIDNYVRPIRLFSSRKKASCSKIVSAMFHEYRHRMQNNINHDESFDLVFCDISRVVAKFRGKLQYFFAHDSFYFEVDANNYGTQKAIEYFQMHSEMNKFYDTNCLNKFREIYQYDRCVYDFDRLWTSYNMIRNYCPMEILDKLIKKDKKKIWHKVFYGNKKKLRSFEEIVYDDDFNKVDSKVVNYIFTSRYFNEQLDYSKLSDELIYGLLREFQIRRSEVLQNIEIVMNNKTESRNRKSRDVKRLNNEIKYYEDKIKELFNILDKNRNKKR